MNQPPTYSLREAKKLGYQSITKAYSQSDIEQNYLRVVLRDMIGVDHCLIETGYGIEVARLKKDLL